MNPNDRHTRKPRLFRTRTHCSRAAMMLLALSPAMPALAANDSIWQAPAPTDPAMSVPIAGLQCEPSRAPKLASLPAPTHPSLPSATPPGGERASIGWIVALLLAGIAVGRHCSRTLPENA